MIIGNNKIILFKFMPYEYKALEKYLDKMALRGWILKGAWGYFLKFSKEEPKKLEHTVVVVNNVYLSPLSESKESSEYKEYCEAAGWSFVCGRDNILIFNKNNDKDLPIETDENEKFKSVFKYSLKYILSDAFATLMILFSQGHIWFGGYSPNFLADNFILLLLLILFIWTLQSTTQLIHFLIWSIGAKRKLDIGNEISYKFKFITNIKLIFNKLVVIAILSSLIIGALYLGGLFTITIFIIGISIWLGFALHKKISKSNYGLKKRRIIFISGILLILLVNLSIMPKLLLSKPGDITVAMMNRGKEYPLTLEDFGDISINSDYKFKEADRSVLLTAEALFDEGKEMKISYDIYKSRYKSIIDYSLKIMLDRQLERYHGEVIELSTTLPSNIKVYKVKNESTFVIASEKKFISAFIETESFSDEEIVNIIYKNVF